jgi:hypothetical protein
VSYYKKVLKLSEKQMKEASILRNMTNLNFMNEKIANEAAMQESFTLD